MDRSADFAGSLRALLARRSSGLNTVDSVEAKLHRSMSEIDAARWRECFGEGDPFLSWDFLHGLEASGCTTTESGWQPAHLSIELSGEPAGMMPTYLKTHSYGE